MSAIDTQFYKKKKSRVFWFSLWFLLFICLLTGILFFYNSLTLRNNTNVSAEIQKIHTSISEIEADHKIQVYKIYAQHKVFLEMLWENSKIPVFVAHLKKTFRKYALEATGFNYSWEGINLEVKWQTNDAGYAYEKIVKMLREYNTDAESLFRLEKVTSFIWYDTMTYTTEFRLKK